MYQQLKIAATTQSIVCISAETTNSGEACIKQQQQSACSTSTVKRRADNIAYLTWYHRRKITTNVYNEPGNGCNLSFLGGHYFDECPPCNHLPDIQKMKQYQKRRRKNYEASFLIVCQAVHRTQTSLKIYSVHSFVYGNMKLMFHIIVYHFQHLEFHV